MAKRRNTMSLAEYFELMEKKEKKKAAGSARDNPRRRSPSRNEEHALQCRCKRWFNLKYPDLKDRLFAVPNGGKRDAATAAKLKAEGVVAGVADLMLAKKNKKYDYGGLFIEMKTPTGVQSRSQKKWQQTVCSEDEYKYVICRSLDDFIKEITEYLNN